MVVAPGGLLMEPSNKRQDARVLVLETGTIRAERDGAPVDCAVLNVSTSGACILVPKEVPLPDRFELRFDRDGTNHSCRMVWREGGRLGVAFVR